jgi:hypothetical protein
MLQAVGVLGSAAPAPTNDLPTLSVSRAGHLAISPTAMLDADERMVYGSIETLNGLEKSATAKHIRELVARKLITIVHLIKEGGLEATLQKLYDKGFVSQVQTDAPPGAFDRIDTNAARREGDQ